jgi:hypothetical protein
MHWCPQDRKYQRLTQEIHEKNIAVRLIVRGAPARSLLDFAGPTGCETYSLDDMRDLAWSGNSDFAACAGTVNSWPGCFVNVADIRKFLEDQGIGPLEGR